MRKFFGICLILASMAALVSYGLWTQQRPQGHYLSDLRIHLAINEGQPGERGNLLGIEPELFPTDYQNPQRLHRKLAAYLQHARELGLINARTIVVLPEHVGTWLFVSGEKNELFQASDRDDAMSWLPWSNPLQFIKAFVQATGENRLEDTYLRMKASSMAQNYQTLFGGLAREFGVTLVAGSIVLPEPRVEEGQLRIGSGDLYNSSLVFGSDGLPLGQPQRQLFASHYQHDYVETQSRAPLNVIDTPAGRLAVLIGSDSWYPSSYTRLNESGAELIAVPAFVPGKSSWAGSWRGLRDKSENPGADLKPGTISEGEAWHQLTLTGRKPDSNARAGISVFLHGQFWNQGSSGQGFASDNGQIIDEQQVENSALSGARLINIWL
ncbi:nitrilase-related carbon-nitrogen hydrolase [Pseudomonas cichorii]|uniref:nitrilase-related carbon-nitrogen hydrolase n=1 Tax=Pseudomonas cichorii TaxID=36746 RepID=UPI001C88F1C9|nr:nitrilase-related carbon-nitrogen hydrolase [Pseudomonas cichorii]MBX8483867.1 carbon-nitrogen hydrolase family protein [Pseudomonas cichorii]MBX8494848.1 carbon-nitrogen hydrolase family protein [Pseudomonas cichorii]MBX8567764.1 carbon-nitrogen hydrolase family protein [Pseudomonas cichorii]